MTTEKFLIKFRIKKIIYREPIKRTAIVKAIILEKPDDAKRITKEMIIKGIFPSLFENDEFEGTVEYTINDIYGPQLNLLRYPNYIIPENEKALAKFIAIKVKGLGEKKALKIVEDLGLNAIDIICEGKVDFTKYGIKEKREKQILKALKNVVSFERLAIYIQELGYPLYYAVRIYKEFEENSLQIIKENPYKVCLLNLLPFTVADKLAKKHDLKYDNPNRIQAAIHSYINFRIHMYGDVCIYQTVLLSQFNNYLKQIGVYQEFISRKKIMEVLIKEITEKRLIVETDIYMNSYLYEPIYAEFENIITKKIVSLVNDWRTPFCKEFEIDMFLDDWEDKYGELDELQVQAVKNSLLNNISILTGNPGTGKTFTTNLIVKCIQSIKKHAKICLLAPTGKASERITELTGLKASTIHRGLNLKEFSTHTVEKIEDDFIIIDESSMIDISLFAILMNSIGDNSRVIFVGDIEQLPPVGSGLILKDLIECKVIPTIKLTKIFRQAKDSDIIMNAHAMIHGLDSKKTGGFTLKTKPDSDFCFISENNTLKIQEKIEKLIDDLLASGYKLNDICLLSPMKNEEIGTIELNERLQKKLNPNATNEKAIYYDLFGVTKFYIGDRVIQTKNNYDLQVFNGYVGEILNIFEGVDGRGQAQIQMTVDYPQQGKTVTYSENEICQLDLCYAMTIHKSQGSEFPVVIMPIHFVQKTMLNRNLLYTGLTRGKKQVYMIGQSEAIDYGINHMEHFQRISRVKEKILFTLKEKELELEDALE